MRWDVVEESFEISFRYISGLVSLRDHYVFPSQQCSKSWNKSVLIPHIFT